MLLFLIYARYSYNVVRFKNTCVTVYIISVQSNKTYSLFVTSSTLKYGIILTSLHDTFCALYLPEIRHTVADFWVHRRALFLFWNKEKMDHIVAMINRINPTVDGALHANVITGNIKCTILYIRIIYRNVIMH